jgi:prolyl-tRNA synthetase
LRLSAFLPATTREDPSGTLPAGYRRLVRAGYVRQAANGEVLWLPLGLRLVTRLADRLADALGTQGWAPVLAFPGTPPGVEGVGAGDLPPIGAPDAPRRPPPAGLTALAGSYKRLPLKAFHIAWRRQPPQEGDPFPSPVRLVLEAWAVSAPPDVQVIGQQLGACLSEALLELGLAAVISHLSNEPGSPMELCIAASGSGSEMLGCSQCGFVARPPSTALADVPLDRAPLLPLERVATPGSDSILALCTFLGIPPERTAKAMLFAGKPPGEERDQGVMVMVRGDRDVSWQKIAWASGWRELRRASAGEVEAIGAVPGFASPVGLRHPWILVDQAVANSRNLVTGANQAGFHLLNTTCGRDYAPWRVADLSVGKPGDACPACGEGLRREAGLLLGACSPRLPELGDLLGSYADRGGAAPLAGVCLEADLTTAVGMLADGQADDRGLAWRPLVAPFATHVIAMPSCEAPALELHAALILQGIDVLLDDREASPGAKLKDADLIGLPVRVVVSQKSMAAGGAELTPRAAGEPRIVPLEDVGSEILRCITQSSYVKSC